MSHISVIKYKTLNQETAGKGADGYVQKNNSFAFLVFLLHLLLKVD